MKNLTIPLVDWGMGAVLIGFFAVVCIGLISVVLSIAKSDKSANGISKLKKDTDKNETE